MSGFRKSFSLIEILFSIVIIATILTPIPSLLKSIDNISHEVVYKNSLFLGLKHTILILSLPWDENVYEDDKYIMQILDTNSSHFTRKSENFTRKSENFTRNYNENRLYFETDTNHSRFASIDFNDSNDIDENNKTIRDDIDDFNNTNNVKTENFNFNVSVFYVNDEIFDKNSSSIDINLSKDLYKLDENSSNLKFIKLTGKESIINGFEFQFKYISANIGEGDIKHRSF
jgi:hypothetical protein